MDTEKSVFDRKLSDVPCLRSSFMYGILTGIGSGLAFFMFTSRPRRSCDVAVGVFTLSTFGLWSVCRYNAYNSKVSVRMKRLMDEKKPLETSEA